MTPYRVALIGTGRVGYQFNFSDLPDNHAEAIQAHPRCALVAGVNRGREKLVDFGQRFGVEALYHDYRQMLREVAPDICIITTHPQHHAEMVAACAAERNHRERHHRTPPARRQASVACERNLRLRAA